MAGRQGLVRAVDGRHVEVVFPEGSETLDIDDLTLANLSPVENLMAGELGDTEAFALRLQSLYLRHAYRFDARAGLRSEERRVGNGCVRTCRSRWSQYP